MLEKVTHTAEPSPIKSMDNRSYRVKVSLRSLQESILLKTRLRDDVELMVIISAQERLPNSS